MFELPELMTLAAQANEVMQGRVVRQGRLGNRPHKFVWYNRSPEEFAGLTAGKRVGRSEARGRWLFIDLEPGYRLVFGEFGGRMLLHEPGAKRPAFDHLCLEFSDGAALTVTTAMWGAMELHEAGAERDRQYIRDMRPSPIDPAFTLAYFADLIAAATADEPRTVKGLLTQAQLVPGLGNSIAQDIAWRAHLHPRRALADLDDGQRRALYDAIVGTVREAIALGGRSDEVDLFGRPGRYQRRMDKEAVGRACPECGSTIGKIQYLGGACYVCPGCQG